LEALDQNGKLASRFHQLWCHQM